LAKVEDSTRCARPITALKRLASAVQLRPWPPHFKTLSYPGLTLVLWVATHDNQKLRVATH
jgi:hypothetical protein